MGRNLILSCLTKIIRPYKNTILLVVMLFFCECIVIIGASGKGYNEVKLLIYLLWIILFLPSLLTLYYHLKYIKKPSSNIPIICMYFLLFLYFSIPSLYYGSILMERNFNKAVDNAQIFIYKLNAYHSEKGFYPPSLDECFDPSEKIFYPRFTIPKYFYKTDGDAFTLKLYKPDRLNPYVYYSNLGHWEYEIID